MKQIGSIQILRALAATMVVLAHAQDDAAFAAQKIGTVFARSSLLPWVAGVDLFFVISGFIMVHASERLFATPGAAQAFLTRRVIRIVPLYWLATALALVTAALLVRTGQARLPGVAEIVTSLGFIPFARPGDGVARPIVALGWTLNYEMFFYVVFAAFLMLRREAAVAAVTAMLALLVVLGLVAQPAITALAFWSDPIVLEFALGMAIALAWRRGVRLPRPAALALGLAAVAVLALDLARMRDVPVYGVDPSGLPRLLACGLPMAALFAAVVLAQPAPQSEGRLAASLRLIGDASYALYLFHPLVLVAARKAYLASHLAPTLGFWPLVLAEIAASALVAVAMHLWIETPVTRLLNARFADRRSAASVPGTVAPVR
ncbi:Acyltransferase [Beijerinckiaceae bacterium RH AL1]|nr:acyltransferase [Beijerinckiaceae bacterium]VVB44779.1 Acyltransferase [Beijerinckiaceae bacterium RH CH11]VVB44858.1 Acyltransferase [Beijerinckiaceae bacterium RH AL8]VVC54532.1 Acyltransferase [Beijerinckiaceae bacterium RH AL1]